MKYSASTQGFYPDTGYLGTVPSDAVSVSDEDYRKLLLANSQGASIQATSSGTPEAVTLKGTVIDLSTVTTTTNFVGE